LGWRLRIERWKNLCEAQGDKLPQLLARPSQFHIFVRPPKAKDIAELVVHIAQENPTYVNWADM
jgi:hypothetical protein